MLKRVITGVLLLAIVFALIALQGWYLRAGLLVMALAAMHEVYNAFANREIKPVRWTGFVFVIIAFAAEAFSGSLIISADSMLLMGLMQSCTSMFGGGTSSRIMKPFPPA